MRTAPERLRWPWDAETICGRIAEFKVGSNHVCMGHLADVVDKLTEQANSVTVVRLRGFGHACQTEKEAT